jgi:peptidoglycan/xylan/chitin deacetylase (PgdA/CDA1 family)
MKKFILLTVGILFALACQTLMPNPLSPEDVPALSSTLEIDPAMQGFPPASSTPQIPNPIPTETFSPTPTSTVSLTPTLELIRQGPDAVTVPILLYHHIESPRGESKYYVAPKDFDEQMKLLHDWGYTTIPLDLLVKAIKEGADLPARPIIITFDDGQLSVYTTAFPIMQRYGFTGVVYIVGSYMDSPTFMTTEQVKELTMVGWEVGSHSMKHKDLTTLDEEEQKYEVADSRKWLMNNLDVPVHSFAYPWGFVNEDIFTYVHNAGYTSAMGLGYGNDQGIWNIFLLNRRDVLSTYDLKKFASFLPWYGDASFLPTDTPTPTPTITRTPRPTKKP